MRVIHAIRFAFGVIRHGLGAPNAEDTMMLGRGRHLGPYVAGSLAALESVLRGPERSFGWDPLDMKFLGQGRASIGIGAPLRTSRWQLHAGKLNRQQRHRATPHDVAGRRNRRR
jgi:hypothetical protein